MQNIDLKTISQNTVFHFVGIDGIGMSSIAEVLLKLGFKVQGSNEIDGENIKSLERYRAKVFIGHSEANIEGADIIVFSAAVPQDNVELVAARDRNLPIIERPVMLQSIMNLKKSVGVSGTHGKTTTTSFIGTLLDIAGKDPIIVDGGIMNYYNSHNRVGNGEFVVAEVCEAFGSLQYFSSDIAIITNIDAEHMEYYKTFENLEGYFKRFVDRVPEDGLVVACYDHDVALRVAMGEKDSKTVITYGFSKEADIYATNCSFDINGAYFDVHFKDGKLLEKLHIPIVGTHNILNSLAAVAVAKHLNINDEILREALKIFEGTKHRFTKVDEVDGIKIFDDYAHHPKEIEATLSMAKNIVGNGKIFTIFQPHRYSRLTDLFDEFFNAFNNADYVICMPVYAAGESEDDFKNHNDFYTEISKNDALKSFKINNFDEISQIILSNAKSGDIIVSLGAGSIKHTIYDLPLLLKK